MTRLAALGDSIFEGWDGHTHVPKDRTIPATIGKINGWDVVNKAIGGTQFGGNNGFTSQAAITNFFAFDIVLVNFGVNDWCYPGNLNDEKDNIQTGINNIHRTNKNIPILFELPTEDFRNGSTSLDDKNSHGWSQNDLCNLIIQIAKANGCQYYDWRSNPIITPANHTTTLGDGQVHPTQAVMDQIAQRLAPVLKAMVPNDTPPTPVTPTRPTNPSSQPTNPGSGDGSDNPPKPLPKLTLDRLSDVFKIGDNVNENAKKTIDFVNQIYQGIADLYAMEAIKTDLVASYSNNLDRILRDGVIMTVLQLQFIINDLIKYCNRLGIVDMMTGKTELITLDPPRRLTIDQDYEKQLNAQWETIETILNKLYGYLAEQEGVV